MKKLLTTFLMITLALTLVFAQATTEQAPESQAEGCGKPLKHQCPTTLEATPK